MGLFGKIECVFLGASEFGIDVTDLIAAVMNLSDVKDKYPDCEIFLFGDSRELCELLTALVISGKKTATCEALHVYESGGEAMPTMGRIDIATDWDGIPVVAIRTTHIDIKAFVEVSEEFALAEGENDDLAGWRKDHKAYFERAGQFDTNMPLVCERFEVVEVFRSMSGQCFTR